MTVCMSSPKLAEMWSVAFVVAFALLPLVARSPSSKIMGGHAWNR